MSPFTRKNRGVRLPAALLALFAIAAAGAAPAAEPAEELLHLGHVHAYIERTRGWKAEEYSVRSVASEIMGERLPVYRVFPDIRGDLAPLDKYPVDIFLDGRSGEVVGEDIVRPTTDPASATSPGDAP